MALSMASVLKFLQKLCSQYIPLSSRSNRKTQFVYHFHKSPLCSVACRTEACVAEPGLSSHPPGHAFSKFVCATCCIKLLTNLSNLI